MLETIAMCLAGGGCFVLGAWCGRKITLSEWRMGALGYPDALLLEEAMECLCHDPMCVLGHQLRVRELIAESSESSDVER